jgi:4-amino-4-deoxy-L-arabinose transferase-like glycosyltransferase
MDGLERQPWTSTQISWLIAIALAVAAAAVYISIADWPFGTHIDEVKKARYIISGERDFYHPILLLQLARIANVVVGYTEPSGGLVLGRVFSGIFGGLLVFATFVLGQAVLRPATALAAAAAVAVTPLVAIHATFLKEDIYVAPAIVFALAALLALTERPTTRHALAVGLFLGIAASAKYVGAIILPYAIITVLVTSGPNWKTRLRLTGIILVAAVAVFFAINMPAIVDPGRFSAGLGKELNHAIEGHFDVKLPIWLTGGVFHLQRSLLPGLGWPLLILGIAGLAAPLLNPARRRPLAVILGAAFLWYFAHEISPLKPFPNVERYMVPLAPMLVILGASVIETIASWRSGRLATITAPTTVVLCAVPAFLSTYAIVSGARHDLRRIMPEIVDSFGPRVHFDNFVGYDRDNLVALARAGGNPDGPPNVFVTSSFVYDRLGFHADDPSQPADTKEAFDFYSRLFQQPYLELSSGPSFAFLNPVIRVVSLDNDIDRLVTVGKATIAADPSIRFSIGP